LRKALEFCVENPQQAESVVGIQSLIEITLAPLLGKPDLDRSSSEALRKLAFLLRGFEKARGRRKVDLSLEALAVISSVENLLDVASLDVRSRVRRTGRTGVLGEPLRYVRGIGPGISKALAKKGILTVGDFLYFLPRTYQDRRELTSIVDLKDGEHAVVVAEVIWAGERVAASRKKMFEAQVTDQTGILHLRWFNYSDAYLKSMLEVGARLVLSGEVRLFRGASEMHHPDMERLDTRDPEGASLHFGRIVPVYSETANLSTRIMRKLIRNALDAWLPKVVDPIPTWVLDEARLPYVKTALGDVHFPPSGTDIEALKNFETPAQKRLVFEELFLFAVGVELRRRKVAGEPGPKMSRGSAADKVLNSLPFELTSAQKRVISEIENDLAESFPMNRLLQGDVGSGKTIVAGVAVAIAHDSGYQAAVMAPTEILARQHWRNFSMFLKEAGIEVGLLVADMPKRAKEKVLGRLRSGRLRVVVGTHALIQGAVEFSRLGLVVIDEQHRFGVLQRAALKEKARGIEPNVLVMTATPIPRSLALTIYGDLDLSTIDEMPGGRAPVVTQIFYENEREKLYRRIRERMEAGERVFVVYPVIDESVDGELVGATRMFEELSRIFKEFDVGLVHGRMRSDKKDKVMNQFASGRIDMLVATTVIEVGIDVPEATVMVIERADRFGLSQLHQLRGRVGRGEKGGYCFLVTPRGVGDAAERRLRILTETGDGFKISEEDLRLRGPGEFLGTRQSGAPNFKVANLVRDYGLVVLAKRLAAKLVQRDQNLKTPEHSLLKDAVLERWGEYLKLADVG